MKRIFHLIVLCSGLLVSCGPSKHAVHVEMRYPSKSGIELAGKVVSVVFVTDGNEAADSFNESMAGGFAEALEKDYGTGEGSVGVYSIADTGGKYGQKDTLVNLLMDTGADVVFLFDKVELGEMGMGGVTRVSTAPSPDSSYLSTGVMKYSLKLYCFDAMNPKENVYVFSGSSLARPDVYSNGRESDEKLREMAVKNLPEEAWEAGNAVASSFLSQWKHEQYSIIYYDNEKWYKALDKAEGYDWKGAMDIWISMLGTNDLLKRACAEYDIAVACYMLGDYSLASEWLDRSDKDNKLPLSDALRKRIDARL